MFIACTGIDISSLSPEFELDNEMLTTDEFASINDTVQGIMDAARQVRNPQVQTTSMHSAVKTILEAACSHRQKMYLV